MQAVNQQKAQWHRHDRAKKNHIHYDRYVFDRHFNMPWKLRQLRLIQANAGNQDRFPGSVYLGAIQISDNDPDQSFSEAWVRILISCIYYIGYRNGSSRFRDA